MQNKNIFQSRSQYLEVVKELYSELSKNKAGKKFPWFIIRIQTAYFFHLIYGGKLKVEDVVALKSKTTTKSLKSIIRNFGRKIILVSKITKTRSILKNKLKNQTLYLGYKAHNIQNGLYNMYLHPFWENVKGEIFYLDAESNDLQLQNYYNDLLEYFTKKKIINDSVNEVIVPVINYLSNRLSINLNFLENSLNSTIQNFSVKQKVSKAFLETLSPNELFVYCYYDSNTNAFVHAANDININTIEYQHSSISDNHFAYSKWENNNDVCRHFPKLFYVWSEADKALIINNFSSEKYIPKVEVVGNKYLQKTIENSKTKNIENNNILICLQGQWIPKFLEDFIYQDQTYNWYFRLHPRYPQDNIQLQDFISKKVSNVIVEKANVLELYDLFDEISILMTSFSGTALEAEKFGKKVIIFGKEGYNSYYNKIENRIYSFIEKLEDINQALFQDEKNIEKNIG